jgi:hypothetical protein
VGFLQNLFGSRTTNPPGLTADSKWLIEENRSALAALKQIALVRTYEFSDLPPPQPATTLRLTIFLTMSPYEQHNTRIAYPSLLIHLRPYRYLLRPPRKRFPDHLVKAPFRVGLRATGSGAGTQASPLIQGDERNILGFEVGAQEESPDAALFDMPREADMLHAIRTISLGKELSFTILDSKAHPPVKLRLQLPNDRGFQKLYKKLPALIGARGVRS